jgi:hypothetical protein
MPVLLFEIFGWISLILCQYSVTAQPPTEPNQYHTVLIFLFYFMLFCVILFYLLYFIKMIFELTYIPQSRCQWAEQVHTSILFARFLWC